MHALFCLAKENKKINKKIPKKPQNSKNLAHFISRESDEKLLK